MATELLAAGTTKASSAEFTLVAGESATLLLKGASGKTTVPLRAQLVVQAKDSGGVWRHHLAIRGVDASCVLTAVGTFRVYRPVQGAAVGIDKG